MSGLTNLVYILVGTPGSGKTWVANQLRNQYTVCEHDVHGRAGPAAYATKIAELSFFATTPILAEVPFSLSQLQDQLMRRGLESRAVFICESEATTQARYEAREGKPIPQGHLTRIVTYRQRAAEQDAPIGTSEQILNYLKGKANDRP
jgi:hypothetical protein